MGRLKQFWDVIRVSDMHVAARVGSEMEAVKDALRRVEQEGAAYFIYEQRQVHHITPTPLSPSS